MYLEAGYMILDTKSPALEKLDMDRLVLVSIEAFLINEFTQEELATQTLQFSISFQNLLSKTSVTATYDDLEAIAEAGLLDELDTELLDEIETLEDGELFDEEEKEDLVDDDELLTDEEIEEGGFDDEDFEEFGEENKNFFGGVDPDQVDADLRQREEQV